MQRRRRHGRPARAAGARRRQGALVSKAEASLRAAVPMDALKSVARWDDVRDVAVATEAMTHRPSEHRRAKSRSRDREATRGSSSRRRSRPRRFRVRCSPRANGPRRRHGARDDARHRHRREGLRAVRRRRLAGRLAGCRRAAAGRRPARPGGRRRRGHGDARDHPRPRATAELGFATAFTSDASFADNIRALRFDAGCDVIVDDVLYFDESPFQDGPIAQAVNAVTEDGALYFSSAGNEGNTIDGTSGNYEGDFVDSGQGVGKIVGTAHDFDPGPGVQLYNPLSNESAGVPVTLFWADALGALATTTTSMRSTPPGRSWPSRRTCRTATTIRMSSCDTPAPQPAAGRRQVRRRRAVFSGLGASRPL